jgi:hypothetical protein
MHIIVITNPKQVDRDGNILSWKEFINSVVDLDLRTKECRTKGYIVEKYDIKKHAGK